MRFINKGLTQSRLKERLSYDAETGIFIWIMSTTARVPVGAKAGKLDAGGYITIKIDNVQYKAHRLAWLFQTGVHPEKYVDHINGNRSDNRFINLREADERLNAQNTRTARKDNKSSRFLGVSLERSSGKWIASIAIDGSNSKKLGRFQTELEASEAYVAAKRVLHVGCVI